ncbi:MAG: pyrimidine-nucleoside phosphorylase [Bacillota bacterium]
MRMVDLILKKRAGGELSDAEIGFMIRGFVDGTVPDYQMAAFLMAVYFQGMTFREMADLTAAIVASGETIDLKAIPGIKVDKHSTGGVGDKTTLVLAPLVAACGVPVAKMSGRGLGHTGGTIDKLESIPGFRTDLGLAEVAGQVREIGLAVGAQTGDLTPADRLLYALRDVTATVDSIPLIASSVMSKKIASGADAVVLDVKAGAGAFMQKTEDALELARAMVQIGRQHGRRTVALVTAMDEPLGRAVGNALEVHEALAVLAGEDSPPDLVELCLVLAAHMVFLAGRAGSLDEAGALARGALASGAAREKMRAWVRAQGGDPAVVDDPELLAKAPERTAVRAETGGWVQRIDARAVGRAALALGAGRTKKGEPVDPAVGVVLHHKVGSRVEPGAALATVHGAGRGETEAAALVREAYVLAAEKTAPGPLVHAVVGDEEYE